jgi:hypothetical protein
MAGSRESIAGICSLDDDEETEGFGDFLDCTTVCALFPVENPNIMIAGVRCQDAKIQIVVGSAGLYIYHALHRVSWNVEYSCIAGKTEPIRRVPVRRDI